MPSGETVLPPVERYPLPEHLARIMRAGGWMPEDVAGLWWKVETEEDATVLAARSPAQWAEENWPFNRRSSFPGMVAEATEPLPARVIPRLLEAGVPGDLLTECVNSRGITDVDYITSVKPPQIPDDATRIIIAGGASIHVDPRGARETLKRFPGYWLDEVVCESGPVPVHIAVRWHGDPAHMTVWSDGLLQKGYVTPPAGTPEGEAYRSWHLQPQYRRFKATQRLLDAVLYAVNFEELTPDLWMPWQDAQRTETQEVERRATERALAADTTVQRNLVLLRHTVHQADGTQIPVWEVRVLMDHVGPPGFSYRNSAQKWVYGDEAGARARLEELDDGLPPLVTVQEAAELLGTTRNALAQAISRGREQREKDMSKPRSKWDRRAYPPAAIFTGRTSWYDPRVLSRWWHARPGHGPGRGHTA